MTKSNDLPTTVLVIFGAAGDLAWRKLIPALFSLHLDRGLPEKFAVIGLDRNEMDDDSLRNRFYQGIEEFSQWGRPDDSQWAQFADKVSYLKADFLDSGSYEPLKKRLDTIDEQWNTKARRIFYMATPPVMFGKIPPRLSEAGLAQPSDRACIVVEKPIGYDLDSARELNQVLGEHFEESQIFRIDHYLGKETVQNLLAFRFANALFEPIWDRRYVDHIAITVAEEVGVEHRGDYYDKAGALRDMVQNHLLQLFCLVAMEPPVDFNAEEIRNKKLDVLRATRRIAHHDVHEFATRGQYGAGWVKGEKVLGYREEEDVNPESKTETYAALKLFVDNWRWQDVPFYLRTGKRLSQMASEVSIRFRAVPHRAFPLSATLDWQPARLVICIQPDEGIVLKFQAKQPGPAVRLRPVYMRFSYEETFRATSPDAYETLLWDVMSNDATLFMRADQVEAAWSIIMPILNVWDASPASDFPNYSAGSWGPESAEVLIAQEGRSWLQPTPLRNPNPHIPHPG